jgi:hypothetical protein
MSTHQFNYLLQKIENDFKNQNTTFRETSNLSRVSALQVNVILLKNMYWSYKKKLTAVKNCK